MAWSAELTGAVCLCFVRVGRRGSQGPLDPEADIPWVPNNFSVSPLWLLPLAFSRGRPPAPLSASGLP